MANVLNGRLKRLEAASGAMSDPITAIYVVGVSRDRRSGELVEGEPIMIWKRDGAQCRSA
jgi:hypothetical protein